jgi:hypothetical protein
MFIKNVSRSSSKLQSNGLHPSIWYAALVAPTCLRLRKRLFMALKR